MNGYYGEYHQAQQEAAVPNLCPECNGSAYQGDSIITPGSYYEPPEYYIEDCKTCHGTGTIDRPYTERDLWLDEIMHDTHMLLKEAGFDY